jgi:hypothetical protein
MTKEECLSKLALVKKDYDQKSKELERNYKRECSSVLNEWASDNAKYNIGDIISVNDIIITVDDTIGHRDSLGYGKNLYVVYKGRAMTKKLQPRKDEWVTTIYDDGGREIKVLRKAGN